MTQPQGGHILTSKLKKSLQISMHLGGKDINFSFDGGGILILCKIYTPDAGAEVQCNWTVLTEIQPSVLIFTTVANMPVVE